MKKLNIINSQNEKIPTLKKEVSQNSMPAAPGLFPVLVPVPVPVPVPVLAPVFVPVPQPQQPSLNTPVIGQKDNDNFAKLMKAVEDEKIEEVRTLLQKGVNVNQHNEKGFTALMQAAMIPDDIKMVELLVEYKADVNQADQDGRTAIKHAARTGSKETAQFLLGKGARLKANPTDPTTATVRIIKNYPKPQQLPLTQAPLAKTPVLAETPPVAVPVSVGIPLTPEAKKPIQASVDSSGYTSLIKAVRAGDMMGIKTILAQNYDVNQPGVNGYPAIMHAIEFGTVEMVKTLLEGGAILNDRCPAGWTPLTFATALKRRDKVEVLLEAGANIHLKNQEGKTALDIATWNGGSEVVSLISQVKQDSAAFLKASATGDIGTVQRFLNARNKAAIINNAVDEESGNTALIYAMRGNHPEIVIIFLQHKETNVDKKNEAGHVAIDYSILRQCLPAAKVLIQSGMAKITPFVCECAVKLCRVNLIRVIAEQAKKENSVGIKDKALAAVNTIYQLSRQENFLWTIFYLEREFPELFKPPVPAVLSNPNRPAAHDADGLTPFIRAVHEGNIQQIEADIRAETKEIHTCDSRGYPPLIHAVCKKVGVSEREHKLYHSGIVPLLVDKGVHVDNEVDLFGRTALMHAVFTDHYVMVRVLLEYCGAHINKADVQGMTPVICAMMTNNVLMVEALIKRGALLPQPRLSAPLPSVTPAAASSNPPSAAPTISPAQSFAASPSVASLAVASLSQVIKAAGSVGDAKSSEAQNVTQEPSNVPKLK